MVKGIPERGPLFLLSYWLPPFGVSPGEERSAMLRLRPYKSSDAERIITWIKDYDAFSAWCADHLDWPLTEASLEKCRADFAGKEDRWLMTALDERGVPVGFLMMTKADYAANTIHLGMIIVDPALRGRGVGTAFLRLVLAYARDILGMKRVTLRVFDHNAPARACYQRAGFREVSLDRACFPHGEARWDCWNMEALL